MKPIRLFGVRNGAKPKREGIMTRFLKITREILVFLIPWIGFVYLVAKGENIHSVYQMIMYLYAACGVNWISEFLQKLWKLFFE